MLGRYLAFMCGRYLRRSNKQRIAEAFELGKLPDEFVLSPDYNIAPTTFQPMIRESRESTDRELVLMRWGLIPHFTNSLADVKGISTINACAESPEKSRFIGTPRGKRIEDGPSVSLVLSLRERKGAGAWSLRDLLHTEAAE